MSNILRKIAEIKFLYIHITMLFLILVGSVFFATILLLEKDSQSWDIKAIIYLRENGYELEFNSEIDRERTAILLYETHKVIPYFTDEEAWPLSHFWDKWIKWPVRIVGGLLMVVIFIRMQFDEYIARKQLT